MYLFSKLGVQTSIDCMGHNQECGWLASSINLSAVQAPASSSRLPRHAGLWTRDVGDDRRVSYRLVWRVGDAFVDLVQVSFVVGPGAALVGDGPRTLDPVAGGGQHVVRVAVAELI